MAPPAVREIQRVGSRSQATQLRLISVIRTWAQVGFTATSCGQQRRINLPSREGTLNMLVRDSLQKAPVTVPPECTLEEAAGLMGHHGVGALLVVSGGQLVGIVTDRDIAVRGVGTGQSLRAHINTVMTEHPTVVQGSADLLEALQLLRDSGVRRIPVLEGDEIAGIITFDDLLVRLVLELSAVTTPIAGEIVHTRSTI